MAQSPCGHCPAHCFIMGEPPRPHNTNIMTHHTATGEEISFTLANQPSKRSPDTARERQASVISPLHLNPVGPQATSKDMEDQ